MFKVPNFKIKSYLRVLKEKRNYKINILLYKIILILENVASKNVCNSCHYISVYHKVLYILTILQKKNTNLFQISTSKLQCI